MFYNFVWDVNFPNDLFVHLKSFLIVSCSKDFLSLSLDDFQVQWRPWEFKNFLDDDYEKANFHVGVHYRYVCEQISL